MAEAKAKAAGSDPVHVNERKWTKPLIAAGFTVLPNVIFERQRALGLDPLDINIILHIVSYWWSEAGKPHPSKNTIAKAIDVDPRTVQRRIAAMEKAGFIRREERRLDSKNNKTNIYHLEGLIKAAKPYAEEKLQEKEAKAAERTARAARKGKPKLKVVKTDEDE